MKQSIISIASLALVLVATSAMAQELNTSVRASTTPIKARVEMRTNLQDKMQDRRASTTERMMDVRANIEERKAEIRTNMETRRVEIKTNIETRIASTTERRVEMRADLAKRKAEHTVRVMQATIERLEKILVRIESRIEKLKAEGVDVSLAEGFAVEAEANLADAKAAIEVLLAIDLTGDGARENFERIRAVATEVKTHIRAAHENLMKAVRALKDLQPVIEN